MPGPDRGRFAFSLWIPLWARCILLVLLPLAAPTHVVCNFPVDSPSLEMTPEHWKGHLRAVGMFGVLLEIKEFLSRNSSGGEGLGDREGLSVRRATQRYSNTSCPPRNRLLPLQVAKGKHYEAGCQMKTCDIPSCLSLPISHTPVYYLSVDISTILTLTGQNSENEVRQDWDFASLKRTIEIDICI